MDYGRFDIANCDINGRRMRARILSLDWTNCERFSKASRPAAVSYQKETAVLVNPQQ